MIESANLKTRPHELPNSDKRNCSYSEGNKRVLASNTSYRNKVSIEKVFIYHLKSGDDDDLMTYLQVASCYITQNYCNNTITSRATTFYKYLEHVHTATVSGIGRNVTS